MDTPTIEANVDTRPDARNTGAAKIVRRLKRRYPDLSAAEIARKAGCSRANAHKVIQQFMTAGQDEATIEDYRQSEATALDAVRMKLLMAIDDAKIAKSSAYQLGGMFSLLFDKAQLIRGHATSINVHFLLDAVEAVRDMRDAKKQA
jgi:hypothetical protein